MRKWKIGFLKKKVKRENKKKGEIRIFLAAIIALLLTVTGIWFANQRIHINRSVSKILPQAEKSSGSYVTSAATRIIHLRKM